jgi:hypothetical protein
LRVRGDLVALAEAQDLMADLDRAFATVRDQTEFSDA